MPYDVISDREDYRTFDAVGHSVSLDRTLVCFS